MKSEIPQPPWLEFPGIPRFSLDWRFPKQDSHFKGWTLAYAGLTDEERRNYRRQYPPPHPLWTGSYLILSRNRSIAACGFLVTAIVFLSLITLRLLTNPWLRFKID
ncbi:MAG: hypothetical protein AAF802_23955 [Planctomycetota bacterium]